MGFPGFTLPAARVTRLDHSYQHDGPDIIPELPVTSSAARTLQGSPLYPVPIILGGGGFGIGPGFGGRGFGSRGVGGNS
ncbi:hypothetical protein MSG28_004036 [Choristoneura fumiferana]|uniref:Uncharacterized protein n=1 Tax=Choristoneura fumiferana TaxID=7141 RepID=A0ACC0KHZ2_CHOFU|nr:hypothetical protein MSG28_004036 [Choristoneura fumiferana]